MSTRFEKAQKALLQTKYTWLVTGAAGFIGSNLVEFLLKHNQKVIGVDNYATGKNKNVSSLICDDYDCLQYDVANMEFIEKVDFVLHQAAVGSIPRSIEMPGFTFHHNVSSFVNILNICIESDVKRVVYASSSSVKNILSPYAMSKKSNEDYAALYKKVYNIESVGLRYFNVFGPRQDLDSPYSAVIPIWAKQMMNGQDITINGSDMIGRDFTYVDNVVQANILAAMSYCGGESIFEIGCGKTKTLGHVYRELRRAFRDNGFQVKGGILEKPGRQGDIKFSQANINHAIKYLGYEPTVQFESGIDKTIKHYLEARQ